MGDFNLDAKMEYRPDHHHHIPLNNLTEFALNANLTQVINFETWSLVIKGKRKEPLFDHIYVSEISLVNNVSFSTPTFGDHLFVMIELNIKTIENNKVVLRRD